mmetsp:Transcript_13103/g.17880  ORF Transcript_13103/g.17880 Transcript_13103/m.17880 type:complete len:82 (+) Transcript_13103:2447-2692(+)
MSSFFSSTNITCTDMYSFVIYPSEWGKIGSIFQKIYKNVAVQEFHDISKCSHSFHHPFSFERRPAEGGEFPKFPMYRSLQC